MDNRQRLDALELALANEINEREFYLKHAARTKNLVGKAMFQLIADDELEHYERLKVLHEKWLTADKWPETVPMGIKNSNILSALENLVKKVDASVTANTDDMEAIDIATAFEAKGSDAYIELSKSVSDKREKAFFEQLASIEREHYLSLKEVEEYMKDPSSWFIRKEHHSLDGG